MTQFLLLSEQKQSRVKYVLVIGLPSSLGALHHWYVLQMSPRPITPPLLDGYLKWYALPHNDRLH